MVVYKAAIVEEDECVDECRIGCAADDLRTASLVLLRTNMSSDTNGFVTADLRGMKAALLARARASGLGLSSIVRKAVARELDLDPAMDTPTSSTQDVTGRAVQVSIRLTSREATQLAADARQAGLSRGVYVGALVSGVRVTAGRRDHIAALTASCGELATLSRNIHHLATLLRQGSVLAAREYAEMLASLTVEVRRHLRVAADALMDMSPRRSIAARSGKGSDRWNHDG